MTEESRAAGADSRANGEFAAPGPASGEEQIANVGAGDEQNETYRAEEDRERSAGVAEQILFERGGVDAPAVVDLGIGGGEAVGDSGEFELRAGHICVRFHAREDGVGVVAAIGELVFCRKKRDPEFGVCGETEQGLRGHNPDDAVGLAVERDGSADGVRIGGEIFTPEFVAKDDGAIAGLHVGRGEGAAVERTDSEQREEIFGHLRGFESLGLGVSGSGELFRRILRNGDRGNRSGGVAEIGDVRERQAEIGKIEECAASGNVDEFVGMREWERAKENGIDDGEDGGVGADAESESEDSDGGESRGFSEEAQGETRVVEERFEDRDGLLVADELLGLFEPAEFEESEAAGFLRRKTLTEIVIDVELEVGGELGVEVAVVFVQGADKAGKCRPQIHAASSVREKNNSMVGMGGYSKRRVEAGSTREARRAGR